MSEVVQRVAGQLIVAGLDWYAKIVDCTDDSLESLKGGFYLNAICKASRGLKLQG